MTDSPLDPGAAPNSVVLPEHADRATLVARVVTDSGPCVCAVRGDDLVDITAAMPTVAHLLREREPALSVQQGRGPSLGPVAEALENSAAPTPGSARPRLLAPVDLQAIKACGVTFAASMVERVVEEMADGDAAGAAAARAELDRQVGGRLGGIEPGSAAAAALKDVLQDKGLWSQYLEVGLGADAEIFTKAQPLSAVGPGAIVGVHPRSRWNNPEPEVVLLCDPRGRIVGATLGNDVNLRDFEGRSALLLGRAKDNTASCAIGPFVRLFDDGFTLDDVRQLTLSLTVSGEDGFVLRDTSNMTEISRDPVDLAAQLFDCHQYPDGAALFTGTAFAPQQDRGAPGQGFTHHNGDVVSISAPFLGTLINRVGLASEAEPWAFGAVDLFRSLAARGIVL